MASLTSFRALDYANKEHELLPSPLSCRIILIFNVSDSKEKVLEEWKYCNDPNTAPFERVEHANRPVIYGLDLDNEDDDNKLASTSKVVYKLLLQDDQGNIFYGLEMNELPFLHPRNKATQNPLPIPLGGTLVVDRGAVVSFGFILLRRNQCRYLEPDPASEFSSKLNDGLVQKYIEMIDRQLHGIKPAAN